MSDVGSPVLLDVVLVLSHLCLELVQGAELSLALLIHLVLGGGLSVLGVLSGSGLGSQTEVNPS